MKEIFYTADEVALQLGVSKAYAYKIIKKLNNELNQKGFITIAGKVNKDYYNERIYQSKREEV
ncbi:LysR family transcriptional regulator [Thomasclavelia cocleata]|jgi:hypothetical protein|uniref:LysR family transcriptional regulator n=1 Tax=Thomasclavelia cocleata TaxID=69824 RepID=UPI00242DDB07|nr:LysR family transcriptional regulator [Thomasclavelia cocleata]